MFELMVEDTFDAAHALRGYHGPCENLHGHTWKVQAFLNGDKLNEIGLVADFKEIKKQLVSVLAAFDHNYLNEVPPFDKLNPSSENLARHIYNKMKEKLPAIGRVTVWESAATCASYYE